MSKVSRRALARYAADQLLDGVSATKVAKNVSAELVESGRINEYELLVNDILWELESRGYLAVGNVSSAHPLSSTVKHELVSQIKKALGVKGVVLEERLDKSLLGGARVETAGRIWDHSLSAKLSELREVF